MAHSTVGRVLRRIILIMAALAAIIISGVLVSLSRAHQPYESYQVQGRYGDTRSTSIYDGKQRHGLPGNSCCGGDDCNKLVIEPGMLDAVEEGYQITLTVEQARKINKGVNAPRKFVVPWEEIQPSWDGNFHLCIPATMDGGPGYSTPPFYCFWAPPDT